LKDK